MAELLSDVTARIENSRLGRPIVRAAVATLLAHIEQVSVEQIVHRIYRDKDVNYGITAIVKAASAPADMTTSGWADTLVQTVSMADFLSIMGPISAAREVMQRGAQFRFNGAGVISVSGITASATSASFVQEGLPIPVRQLAATNLLLAPRKFATICVVTREIFQHSLPNIETAVKAALADAVGVAADGKMFDAVASDGVRPAGLLNGISGLTPSALTVKSESLQADVQQLIAGAAGVTGVGSIAGNAPIIFIASPAQATALRMLPHFPYEVFASSGLAAAKTVIAIASNALASACDPVPRMNINEQTAVHMNDVPLPIGTAGSPNVVAAPTRSLWQTDSIGLRMVWEVSWGLRAAAGLAWMTNVLW
jgi:hypothetical protein